MARLQIKRDVFNQTRERSMLSDQDRALRLVRAVAPRVGGRGLVRRRAERLRRPPRGAPGRGRLAVPDHAARRVARGW